jgi:prepilin-type N-terminal cleavage/methylation domain-containing protein
MSKISMLRRLKLFNRKQAGFSLIELIATVIVVALIGLVATMAIVQVVNQTSKNNDYTTASRQTLNAMFWISRDVQMAQKIQPDGGGSGFPLVLTWLEWDDTSHTVNYTLENNRLTRSYSINGSEPRFISVADYINQETPMTNCVSDNGVLTLTITSSVGIGAHTINVTKIRSIASRPNI